VADIYVSILENAKLNSETHSPLSLPLEERIPNVDKTEGTASNEYLKKIWMKVCGYIPSETAHFFELGMELFFFSCFFFFLLFIELIDLV
jgi:hypothetical protein